MSTIDVLGEFVTTKEMVENELRACSTVLDAIVENHLDSNLSVKPTSLGLGIDPEYGYENIKTLLKKAKSLGLFVRLDMENSLIQPQLLNYIKNSVIMDLTTLA
jgi:proline dehydrogenase